MIAYRWRRCTCVPLEELAGAGKDAMVVIAPPLFDHIAGLEHMLSLLERERTLLRHFMKSACGA
ncbi:hypothetical protein [Cupriavidus basilensis]|uniref:Uncharacterized protein n=1 Tax=Cupriavidus basilensis TaxID=68895 RepID=A0A0C4YAU4_9BURK|nr:hypothetical protein [Cupriavidus basilensis]AJG22632.1 hypothetical protein RR42_s1043 [Cupriavidus basilensis]